MIEILNKEELQDGSALNMTPEEMNALLWRFAFFSGFPEVKEKRVKGEPQKPRARCPHVHPSEIDYYAMQCLVGNDTKPHEFFLTVYSPYSHRHNKIVLSNIKGSWDKAKAVSVCTQSDQIAIDVYLEKMEANENFGPKQARQEEP